MSSATIPVIRPRPLRPDATLGLWTPSSPAPALFPRRFARCLAAFAAAGHEVVLSPTCRGNAGVSAADPGALADDLHALLEDERVEGILCTAGGYTAMSVLRHLDWGLVRRSAKPIVGYSDVTALLWAALVRAGLTTYHGPMAISEWGEYGGPWPYTLHGFRVVAGDRAMRDDVVLTPPPEWTDELLWWDAEDDRPRRRRPAGPWRALVPGKASGWLLPGCAPTAARLFGTPYMPDPTGAILCLETLEMGPDQFAGLLAQWEVAGLFDRIVGLVVGRHYRPVAAAAGDTDFDAVILRALDGRDLPVLVDVDFGHTEPRLTLPVGGAATVDADACRMTLHPHVSTPATIDY